uniref:Carboxylesterase type B domain-containing protein n=1 Tax=Timema poppense TaxID=170557 RepID=A0A7R9CFS4_TIMPO|nr:unnamed protein product [Timema poppensis]
MSPLPPNSPNYMFSLFSSSTPDQGSSLDLPNIDSLVYCENSALDYAVTEVGVIHNGCQGVACGSPCKVSNPSLPPCESSKRELTSHQQDKLETAPGAAGLASMETLDDSGAAEADPDQGEDGMESVKLDADNDKCDLEKGGDTTDTSKMASWRARLGLLSKFRLLVAVVVIFIILLIIIIAVAASGPRHRDHTSAPIMDGRYVEAVTSCGMVQGLLENGAFSFRGIPYALPPVHERRFLPARPVDQLDKCWNGTFLAHNASTPCWQVYRDGSISGTEDCLTLEVHTPFVRYENPLPVVVLLGADSLSGGSPGPMRATAKLARSKEVVFVTVNFRLGPLGFLATEYLTRSVKPQTSGNYGLSDILTALKWIKLNIEHFNGDKNAVTVFGHRAGGTLVTALTSSKMAKGLFSRAWVSSGSGVFPGKDLAEEQMDNSEYVQSLGCGDADCLKRLDVKELLNKVPGHWRYPAADLPSSGLPTPHRWLVLDGVILRQHLSDVWEKDEGLPIKLVMGASSHSDVPDNLKTSWNDNSGVQVERYVRDSLLGSRGLADEVFRRYNHSYSGLVSLISDIRTVCPLLTLSRSRPGVPFYVVTHPRSEDGLAGVAADVEAILGTYEPRDVEQKRFVTAMQELFYRFVHLGELRREEAEKKSNQNRVLLIGQDANPSRDYPNCDYWIAQDIVPRSRVIQLELVSCAEQVPGTCVGHVFSKTGDPKLFRPKEPLQSFLHYFFKSSDPCARRLKRGKLLKEVGFMSLLIARFYF